MIDLSSTSSQSGFAQRILAPVEPVTAWVWLSYDQLNLELLKGIHERIGSIGILLIESESKGRSRPYHKQKLAFILSNLRHFALEAQASGYQVRYVISKQDYSQTLSSLRGDLGAIHCIEHAERSTRIEVQSLVEQGDLIVHPHCGWLTPQAWFTDAVGEQPPFRMDPFYRTVRKNTGWLMQDGQPMGGKYSLMKRIVVPGKEIHRLPLRPLTKWMKLMRKWR
jgi:deoxyribodipyrimidine photolyase-related protein